MYHHREVRLSKFLSVTVALSAIWCFSNPDAQANGLPPLSRHKQAAVRYDPSNQWPLVPRKTVLHDKPQQVQIYQLNTEMLGERTPLLLVHGLRGEYRRQFRWDKLVKKLKEDERFRTSYKIYLARYDSTASLRNTIPNFQKAVLKLSKATGKPITVMALSLGGNLVYESMQDAEVDGAIKYLFTMATPFHGSPLFSPNWFQKKKKKNLSYPLTRIDHSLSYRLYFKRNPHLLQDLKWDNADGFVPSPGPFRSKLLFGPSGDLTVQSDSNLFLSDLIANSKVDKRKIIAYSGYLLNPYLLPSLRRQFETTMLAPYTFVTIMVPAHLAREHPVLKMLNREISRVIPGQSAPRVPNWPHMYGLNDGITPVNSAIFLPAEACRQLPLAREDDLSKVKAATDIRLARVFRNIDHLTFLDNYRPRRGVRLLRDQLNVESGQRPMFDWILDDLMSLESSNSELARDTRTDDLGTKN